MSSGRQGQAHKEPANEHAVWPATGADLLNIALSRPVDAVEQAEMTLRGQPSALLGSTAHQAIGIVLRDRGENDEALAHLHTAVDLARASGDRQRAADAAATLGAALVMGGRTSRGFGWLDRAAALARGETLARVQMRRAYLLRLLGRHDEAKEDIRKALDGIRRAGDKVWEGRALNSRALISLATGDVSRAERDTRRAQRLFVQTGQDLEAVFALHTLGFIAYSRNDLPRALELLEQAAAAYRSLGASAPELAIDQSMVLLSAGLATEGVAVIEDALASQAVTPSPRAELVLGLANALMADHETVRAQEAAREAAALFRSQQRPYWEARARLVEYRARFEEGSAAGLTQRVQRLAETFEGQSAEEACQAHLLAARLFMAQHRPEVARHHLTLAAAYRHRGRVLTRISAWLAQAYVADLTGSRRSVTAACARGLDTVDQLRASFGSLELRAHGGAHGSELATLGMRQAVSSGQPRAMLRWAERWRATALSLPPVVTGEDPQVGRELAALRASARTLDEARAAGAPMTAAAREHARREQEVLERQRKIAGSGPETRERFSVARLLERLDGRCLVELVEVDDDLYAVVVRDGRVSKVRVGPIRTALNMGEFARVALRNLSIGPTAPLGNLAGQLQKALLGPAVQNLSGRPVVVVPPSRLSSVPWPYLPALADSVVTVAPSSALWLRAHDQPVPHHRRVVLVAGPGLRGAEAEVARLQEIYPDAVVLRGADATVERVLAAVDGAWMVHLAAHGRFRQEAPLFSHLRMYDGPLMVYDLQRLTSCPYRFVLSACESGLSVSPAGTDELLGFASALIGLGAAGVASAVTDVNDLATVQLMIDIHAGLGADGDLPRSMASARQRAKGTSAEVPSACFVSFGL